MTAPASKIHELIYRLEALHRSEAPDELELRRLRQEAQRLLAHDPGNAHIALGIIACLENREAEAINQHEMALRCGWNTQRAINYAIVFQSFYRYDEVIRQAQVVMQRYPSHLEAVQVALRNAYAAGRFQLADQLLAEYRKRVPGEWTSELADIETRVRLVLPMIERLALTDDLIAAMQQPAWALVRTLGGGKKIGINDQAGDDGEEFLSRTLHLPLTFEAAQALDDQLVKQWAEQEEEWPLDKFVITLREQETA
jgi:hypothetical protein